jgi:hypothetical protein
MIVFVATVVPWTVKPTDAGSTPKRVKPWSRPFMNPSEGSAGTVGTFATRTSPVASSTITTSVKVPPISTPMRVMPPVVAVIPPPGSRSQAIATFSSSATSADGTWGPLLACIAGMRVRQPRGSRTGEPHGRCRLSSPCAPRRESAPSRHFERLQKKAGRLRGGARVMTLGSIGIMNRILRCDDPAESSVAPRREGSEWSSPKACRPVSPR